MLGTVVITIAKPIDIPFIICLKFLLLEMVLLEKNRKLYLTLCVDKVMLDLHAQLLCLKV